MLGWGDWKSGKSKWICEPRLHTKREFEKCQNHAKMKMLGNGLFVHGGRSSRIVQLNCECLKLLGAKRRLVPSHSLSVAYTFQTFSLGLSFVRSRRNGTLFVRGNF